MKKINKSRYAILGILFDKPQSGYSILQMMKQSTANFWQESDASVYPMLKKLAAEGKVISHSEHVGKRERNIFEITQTGKDEFWAWMALPPEEENHRNELLLKLFFGANASKEEMIQHLSTQVTSCQEVRKQFKSIENNIWAEVPDTYPHKRFWLVTLRYGMLHLEAEEKWLAECFKALEK